VEQVFVAIKKHRHKYFEGPEMVKFFFALDLSKHKLTLRITPLFPQHFFMCVQSCKWRMRISCTCTHKPKFEYIKNIVILLGIYIIKNYIILNNLYKF
jgi:hypothetical protein